MKNSVCGLAISATFYVFFTGHRNLQVPQNRVWKPPNWLLCAFKSMNMFTLYQPCILPKYDEIHTIFALIIVLGEVLPGNLIHRLHWHHFFVHAVIFVQVRVHVITKHQIVQVSFCQLKHKHSKTTGWPKTKYLPIYQQIVLKAASEIRLFHQIQCKRNTTILSVGIKYSTRDIICEVNYSAWAEKLPYW